ncbi:MAG TPA: ABC transporter ATP-binding protein [Beijerinckiaceae bacterium]|nr:ABC transporter ATP-binding protein [Beijerinckiaceae bacterium]
MTGWLALQSVSVVLGNRTVVADVNATFAPGQFVAIVGPNGAGKTSLLRAVAGRLPCSGSIMLAGQPLAAITLSERARLIGYLPQGHQTHWPLPVRDIVGLGRLAHGAGDPRRLTGADAAAVADAITRTGIGAILDQPATDLSGGERARVALARVLAQQTPLVLADEPTASLDPRYQLQIANLLRDLAREGVLVLAVTHDLSHAAHFADRVLVMNRSQVVRDAAPSAALDDATLAEVFGVRAASDASAARVPWEVLP